MYSVAIDLLWLYFILKGLSSPGYVVPVMTDGDHSIKLDNIYLLIPHRQKKHIKI